MTGKYYLASGEQLWERAEDARPGFTPHHRVLATADNLGKWESPKPISTPMACRNTH